ncbi:hypothetical protein AAW01_04305 [Aurantiacibacter gangjinensis]|uniref:Uncharacterized protein n=1 Tax=Aurantiacibacter gangjinensis TaxID=502682 RepID=A0A0G9MR60_9SPHN|nr:hypothetical protein AAW01_04305 [Aurantiacibacter gangjinensis]
MHTDRKSPRPPRPAKRGPRELLTEALLDLGKRQGRITHHSENSWASITFAGSRHRVVLRFDGAEAVDAGECFIAFLPEHEFAIRGQLVADAAVVAADSAMEPPSLTVTCEILLLEEG